MTVSDFRRVVIIAVCIVGAGFIYFMFIGNDLKLPVFLSFEKAMELQRSIPSDKNNRNYTISWYRMPVWLEIKSDVLNATNCPFYNCKVAANDNVSASGIVIFTAETMPANPIKKPAGQYWVFFSMESPYLTKTPSSAWKNKFDWIMTYRYDSDFTMGYGKIHRRKGFSAKDYKKIYSSKTKDVAWAVSNCKTPSNRETYVKELQKHINVDIYGRCGNLKCGKTSAHITDCHYKFAKEYKFYLAFENSVCRDYTTEKLFNFYKHSLNMIPVILGNRNVARYIPAGTYINALDYPSPKALAAALKEIAMNETRYTQYLKEKDKYTAVGYKWPDIVCPMCQKLNKLNGKEIDSIENVSEWLWNDTCSKSL